MSEHLLWDHLRGALSQRVSSFSGVAGIAVRGLEKGQTIAINGDEIFPTASTIKIHILAQLFRKAEAGELDLRQRVVIDEGLRVPGSGVLSYWEETEQLTVRTIATLMIMVSDNTATNLCIDWATFEGTNAMLRELGLQKTLLQRKMQDHASVARGNENVSTPEELVRFLELLYRGEGLSPYVCTETLRILSKPKKGYLQLGLPADIVLANKPGGMDRVRNDAGIVFLERWPYAIAVMSKYGPPDRNTQEGFIAEVTQLTHDHFTRLDLTSMYGQGVPRQFFERQRGRRGPDAVSERLKSG